MRPKSLILLALALGCGLVASIGISQVLDGNQKQAAVETVPIYVALQNINLGDPVTDAMVSLEEWPKNRVPMGAITTWEEIEDRRPRTPIFQGEPLLDTKLLAKGQTNDPTQGVPEGMRLTTIPVNAQKSAAGLLGPGDRVDLQLFATRNVKQGILEPFTKIFMQNIRVYAVDVTYEKSADGGESRKVPKTVSVVVTPKQSNAIRFAQSLGEISLIPRNPDDEVVIEDVEVGIEEVLGGSYANSRYREQMADKRSGGPGALAGIRSLVEAAMAENMADDGEAAPAPPFEMTIVLPDQVKRVAFTPDGDAIHPATANPDAQPPSGAFTAPEPPPEPQPQGFPIDLQVK